MSVSPLRDKLIQLEHDTFDAACQSGKEYVVARREAHLAVKQYEVQALARLALYPELVKALKKTASEVDYLITVPITAYEVQKGRQLVKDLSALVAQAEDIEKGDKE